MWVIGFPEGLVGVGDVDVQAERFPGGLGCVNPAVGALPVGGDILDVELTPIGANGKVCVPGVGLVGRGMADLASDGGVVSSLFH